MCLSQLSAYTVMTMHLKMSLPTKAYYICRRQQSPGKPLHFRLRLSSKPQFVTAIPGDFFVIMFLWGELKRCHCLQGVWQVVCAACKPPDVSETSHWRRSRQSGCNSRQSGLITTGAWMPSGALGTDSRSGTHLDAKTVPWKK